eukprot:TRINITY_DN16528_c1_g1_i1.p1 TRINITY_DN16528_c1_g1~~TRINITY_DN16528_c1_g1_i1.p1  ORF type:complete len:260 (+),score=50.01 TRINITY_DN16528_c1_g1_i1:128-907(+)
MHFAFHLQLLRLVSLLHFLPIVVLTISDACEKEQNVEFEACDELSLLQMSLRDEVTHPNQRSKDFAEVLNELNLETNSLASEAFDLQPQHLQKNEEDMASRAKLLHLPQLPAAGQDTSDYVAMLLDDSSVAGLNSKNGEDSNGLLRGHQTDLGSATTEALGIDHPANIAVALDAGSSTASKKAPKSNLVLSSVAVKDGAAGSSELEIPPDEEAKLTSMFTVNHMFSLQAAMIFWMLTLTFCWTCTWLSCHYTRQRVGQM